MAWVCLMFHDVVAGQPRSGGGPERFSVSAESFEAMLDAIIESGSAGCSLDAALKRTSRRPVGITFDDGTAGQFELAAPALRSRSMTATFFVTTDWIGRPGFMAWEHLRQLTEWGMSVQSHTKSHPYLSELGEERVRAELAGSKAALDEALGQVTTQMALPAGNAPRHRLRRVFAETGYRVVATSRWGRNAEPGNDFPDEPRWIRRCTVPRSCSPELARRIVTGDPGLAVAKHVREAALNGVRALLGASRYSRWRRRVLDAAAGGWSSRQTS